MPVIREIDCMMCNKKAMLTPRCRFDVDLEDASGSTVGIIMGRYGENILSLTAAEVYKIVSVKKELMPLQKIQSFLSHKMFKIQAKKSLARHPASVRKRFVISCIEKSNAPCSLPTRSLTDVVEVSKRKKDCLLLSDEETEFPPEEVGSLKMKKNGSNNSIEDKMKETNPFLGAGDQSGIFLW